MLIDILHRPCSYLIRVSYVSTKFHNTAEERARPREREIERDKGNEQKITWSSIPTTLIISRIRFLPDISLTQFCTYFRQLPFSFPLSPPSPLSPLSPLVCICLSSCIISLCKCALAVFEAVNREPRDAETNCCV